MVDIPSPKEKKVKFPSAEVEKKGCVYYLNSFKAPPSNHIRFTLVLLKCSSWILQQWFYIHWRTFKNLVEVCVRPFLLCFSLSPIRLIVEALNQLRSVWGAVEGESRPVVFCTENEWAEMLQQIVEDSVVLSGRRSGEHNNKLADCWSSLLMRTSTTSAKHVVFCFVCGG